MCITYPLKSTEATEMVGTLDIWPAEVFKCCAVMGQKSPGTSMPVGVVKNQGQFIYHVACTPCNTNLY